MNLRYLQEHAENALLALELARKEAAQLFLQALLAAREAAKMLFGIVQAIEAQATAVGLGRHPTQP
ncbi:MAG TPA: hypothetical protein VIK56_10170 [Rhodoferax sp.]